MEIYAFGDPMKSFRQQIAAIARRMVDGELDILEGCVQAVALRGSLDETGMEDPDLLFLVLVESELDDVPVGDTRKLWAPEALAEKDRKAHAYLEQIREDLLEACRSLIRRWESSE